MTLLESLSAFGTESIDSALLIIELCGLNTDIKRKINAFLAHIIRCIETGMIIRFGIVVNAAEA